MKMEEAKSWNKDEVGSFGVSLPLCLGSVFLIKNMSA